jgi:hypothetical protein
VELQRSGILFKRTDSHWNPTMAPNWGKGSGKDRFAIFFVAQVGPLRTDDVIVTECPQLDFDV